MKATLLTLLVQLVLLWGVVRWVDKQPDPVPVGYSQALALTSSNLMTWIQRNSTGESAALARFRQYWSNLSAGQVDAMLSQVYAENVWFNDTVKTITNRAQLTEYMLRTVGHVESCRVDIKDIAATDEGYYARWEMTVIPKNAEPGTVWQSIGVTHLRINADGQVILHQDYWDSAGALYEHFPGIGWILRNIRARL